MIGLKDDGLESLRWKLHSMSEYHLQGRSRHLSRSVSTFRTAASGVFFAIRETRRRTIQAKVSMHEDAAHVFRLVLDTCHLGRNC